MITIRKIGGQGLKELFKESEKYKHRLTPKQL